MRIITVSKEETSLYCVGYGAVFRYNDSHYMKLKYETTEDLPHYENGASPTAVCLEDGSLVCFAETTPVEVMGAELRVKE